LEWRGLIEDPLRKRIRKMLLAVMLVVPVNFTSTGPNAGEIQALTWEYKQQPNAGHVDREFRWKVHEISEAFSKELVPAFVKVIDEFAPQADRDLTTEEVQQRLRVLGFYSGPVDGIAGPRTVQALRLFQMSHALRVTGHPDRETTHALRAAGKA
jgi:hypothetical protein